MPNKWLDIIRVDIIIICFPLPPCCYSDNHSLEVNIKLRVCAIVKIYISVVHTNLPINAVFILVQVQGDPSGWLKPSVDLDTALTVRSYMTHQLPELLELSQQEVLTQQICHSVDSSDLVR